MRQQYWACGFSRWWQNSWDLLHFLSSWLALKSQFRQLWLPSCTPRGGSEPGSWSSQDFSDQRLLNLVTHFIGSFTALGNHTVGVFLFAFCFFIPLPTSKLLLTAVGPVKTSSNFWNVIFLQQPPKLTWKHGKNHIKYSNWRPSVILAQFYWGFLKVC